MGGNGRPDDDSTMRAVLAALDGGLAARPGPEDSAPKSTAHLRVVPAVSDTAESPAAPSRPGRPAAPAADRPSGDRSSGDRPSGDGAAGGEAETVAALVRDAGGPEAAPHAPRGPARLAAEWTRWRPLAPFLAATLAPVPLLLIAGGFGGVFSLVALLWMTGVLHVLDEVLKRRGVSGPGPRASAMADRLSVLLGLTHFGLMVFAVWVLSGATGLGPLSWLATLLAFGLWFGQVSNANAHELIHRTDRRLFRLGMWVYISMLYGHHTSAHRLVHHRFVATTDDPSTAAEGEGFWRFAVRCWPGAFVAGYEMEEHRRARRGARGLRGLNPYTVYLAGGMGAVALIVTLFGFDGLLAYLLLCAHAQLQMLLADYVQHYGLLRRQLPSGALEPAGPRHSWDAPHPFSGLMMLNAPRHADHHAHPGRPWPELRLSPGGEAPLLPYSLPVMATLALVPPLWHRVMDRRLARARRAA